MKTEQIAAAFGGPWAIDRDCLHQRIAQLEMILAAGRVAEVRAAPATRNADKIAIIPLHGVIQQRGNWISEFFGDTSLEAFGAMFDMAMSDPKVKGILIDADTPGGSVYGVPEAAAKVFNARGSKPIVALANSMTASAGYYVVSAADRVYVTPSGEVGSIGVYSLHLDYSESLAAEGIKVTFTKAGRYKAEGNPYEPLGKDAAAYEQQQVDAIYTDFVDAVAKHRGTTPGKVKADFGQGRTVQAREAVQLGMADRVATFDQVLSRMVANRIKTESPAASDDWSGFSKYTAETLKRKQLLAQRARI